MPSQLQPRLAPAPRDVEHDPPAIALDGVTRSYGVRDGGAVHALEDVSLHAERQELLAVVGPSGCGKTTLLELICGLAGPGPRLGQRRRRGAHAAARPAAAVAERRSRTRRSRCVSRGLSRAQARRRAEALFAELGLHGFEDARPAELSGGMRQRVAFLRTLLSGKPVLCLDEPFGALDAITRAEMQAWLAQALVREPRTVVLVTHDVEEAVLLADRVVVLSARPGRVIGELEVPLPRPRARTDAAVVALRERALALLQDGVSGAGAGT